MATTTAAPVYGDTSPLPSGIRTFTSFPDVLMILEFVFGGLVWILVASTRLIGELPLLQGWVMFVSVTLFVCTTLLLILYIAGAHGGRAAWTTLDAFYHFIASLFYLSASVLQASATIGTRTSDDALYKIYQENIAAVVFAYLATLVYVIHAVASLIRWKRSP
ncbi:myelin and lymphocyte protein-like [Leptodactylus fuscus]|uniref:myelin and lymphocyte protein-like n=1 Tax=Leptodactylus fuscus TaxID=238119 RepID=UPI003F4E4AA3